MNIKLAHDFLCPWCWIALKQVNDLKSEFPNLTFDWVGYELMPENLEWPEPKAPEPEANPDKPKTPSRLDLAYAAANLEKPTAERPKRMRSHNALESVEYAKSVGVGDELNEALYRAYWEDGRVINEPAVIAEVAQGIVPDVVELLQAVAERRFKSEIVGFDEDAYAAGVYNVPTFYIDGVRYAEEPTSVLRKAIQKALTVAPV